MAAEPQTEAGTQLTIYGADVEQLEHLAITFAAVGQRTDETIKRIQEELLTVAWKGPDADRFRSEWGGRSAVLAEARDVLRSLATQLRRQASDQRSVSENRALRTAVTPATEIHAAYSQHTGQPTSPGSSSSSNPLMSTADFASRLRDEYLREPLDLRAPLAAEMGRLLSGDAALPDLKKSAAETLSFLSGQLTSGSASVEYGGQWSLHRAGDAAWGPYDLALQASLGADAQISGSAGIENGQLRAAFAAGAKVGAYTDLSASTEIAGFVPVGVHAEAMAGAQGDAAGNMAIGENGLAASGAAEGFAGARASAEASLGLGDYGKVDTGGEAWIGVGAKASGEASIGWNRTSFGVDLGVAALIGAEFSLRISFSPKGIISDLSELTGLSKIHDLDLETLATLTGANFARRATKEAYSAAESVTKKASSIVSSGLKKVGGFVSGIGL